MCEPRDIQQIINVLMTAFPNFKPSVQTPEIYYRLLQDISSDELKAAVLHCVSEPGRAFAPSIGEIRGAVGDLRKHVANVPTSYEAWQEVLRQISDVGSYGSPQFSNPLIDSTVRALGWRNLCLSENQTADRARFVQCYEQLLSRAERDDLMLPEVKGYIEANGAPMLPPGAQIKMLADRLAALRERGMEAE